MMTVQELTELQAIAKEQLLTLGAFCANGKFNRYVVLPQELVQLCFRATPRCLSSKVKDRIYWVIHGMHDYRTCETCGSQIIREVKNLSSVLHKQRYCNGACTLRDRGLRQQADEERLARSGFKHQQQDPKVREKVRQTCLDRYGVENVFQHEPVKERIKQTLLGLYGVDNISRHPPSNAKKEETCLERFGVSHVNKAPWIREKASQTCMQRYGKRNPNQVKAFQLKLKRTNLQRYGSEHPAHTEKARQTSLKRYGVPHPMQSFQVFKKVLRARFRLKHAVIGGTSFTYQGYEDVVIRYLIEERHTDPRDVLVGRTIVPKVFYFNTLKRRRACYYPDIYVKSQRLLIEVKSDYTLKLDTQVYNKQRACKEAGYEHLLAICTAKRIIEVL